MIIDAHTHLGKKADANIRVTADHLLNIMDKNKIDKAVVTSLSSNLKHNKYVHDELKGHSDRLIGFYWINPRCAKTIRDLMDAVSLHGFRGLKLRPESDVFRINNLHLMNPIMEVAAKQKIPLLIHSSAESPFSLPTAIARIAEVFPEVTIIMGHMGAGSKDAITVAHKNPNIVLETSGVSASKSILEAVRVLGPKRIVFGSDFPYLDQLIERKKIEALKLPLEHKRLIMGANMAKILKISIG